jgi:hypothetical protein
MNRPTTPRDVLLPLVLVGAVAYLLLRVSYSNLPLFQWYAAIPIAALAIAEFVVARRVRRVVRHDPSAKVMTAVSIARSVALGKASVLVGSGAVGASAALIATVLPDASRTVAAAHDLRVGVALLIAALLLAAAGLTLERAGLDPNRER